MKIISASFSGDTVSRSCNPSVASTSNLPANDAVLTVGALQNALLKSANFSSLSSDAKGVLQIILVGAERILKLSPVVAINLDTPVAISDPAIVVAAA